MTIKFKTEAHPQFKDKKCIIADDGAKLYGYFGEARHFMELSEGFEHSGCLSKFCESEGAPRAKELREKGILPTVETQVSIREYFGKSDNFFA